MEKIAAWFDGLGHQFNWKFDFSLLHPFDYFFLTFLLLGLIYGIKRGFLRTTVELFEFFIVIFAVVGNYDWLSANLVHWLQKLPESVAKPTAYFLILSLVWAAVIVIDQNLKQLIQAKTFPPLKIFGGAILGVLYFLLIFALISKGLSLMPQDSISRLFNVGNTRFGSALSDIPLDLYAAIMKKLGAMIGAK